MRRLMLTVLAVLAGVAGVLGAHDVPRVTGPTDAQVVAAFGRQGIRLSLAEAARVRDDVRIGVGEARAHGAGNSKVDFAAVTIASTLGLDVSKGSATVRNVAAALGDLARGAVVVTPPPSWDRYYDQTVGLTGDASFQRVVAERSFHPVKISWEDIGRHEGSVWGDRISDVGIWVRRREDDPGSAQLALSVRRDSNFRDKVLMVPGDAIKVHQRVDGRTIEKSLPQRLAELGVSSPTRDRHVIVSNQFAIVPVPGRDMPGASPDGVPPRAAFTFSIFPYGSTNLVITDVIEGSHEAIVGPGNHQLLYANVDGGKAPFTASRAEDRQDLLKLERELKAKGMDVDVQRYYLIQVPLRRDVAGLRLSNMGTPPFRRPYALDEEDGVVGALAAPAPAAAGGALQKAESQARRDRGLARVAIGTGEVEGAYDAGGGFRGARAEEPVRVTVVYFVTPVGKVTSADMAQFAKAFEQWDGQAVWGGSFVTKETF